MIAIRNGEPFLWDKHWRRLAANAEKLSIDLSEHNEAETLNSLRRRIDKLSDGRARLTFFDESPSTIWSSSADPKTSLQIITGERRKVSDLIHLTVSPHRIDSTSPLAGTKSCNYLEHLMALEEANRRGFEEAVRLNQDGHITSACMANIFWSKDGKLYTPSLKTGCVAGTTREFVLEKIETVEAEAGIAALDNAEQIFLTSAGLGVVAAAEFNSRKLAVPDHEILSLL